MRASGVEPFRQTLLHDERTLGSGATTNNTRPSRPTCMISYYHHGFRIYYFQRDKSMPLLKKSTHHRTAAQPPDNKPATHAFIHHTHYFHSINLTPRTFLSSYSYFFFFFFLRQGQEALRWHLRRLNLPPEEWADDVRDVNAQLVEALEQLQEREKELDEHEQLVSRCELGRPSEGTGTVFFYPFFMLGLA